MQPRELRPGLWRWSTPHPGWEPDAAPESPADWPRAVGCTLYETEDAAVLVDPLLPPDPEPFVSWLDERVAGRPVVCLTTIRFHRRSRDAIVERYGASTSRGRRNLPAGVETFVVHRAGETMVWLPGPRALAPGDRLLGNGAGGLRLCPESWLRYLPSGIGLSELREALRPLLDLPIELVLVSHGEPVLKGGREAIVRAIRQLIFPLRSGAMEWHVPTLADVLGARRRISPYLRAAFPLTASGKIQKVVLREWATAGELALLEEPARS